MKLKEIHRTSTFAWSPMPSIPLLATGTVAGALDESFSNDSQLEIWAPDFLDKNEYDLGGEGQTGAKAAVTTNARFNRISWGYVGGDRTRGVIAAGMESGALDIWDPAKILANEGPAESLILRNTTHTGPIRGLDFNPLQTSLFSSGATNGEIYIWDLKDPSKPYSPGTRSSKLDEITALAWNHQVPHVLATSSSTGYTVVWDLRGKREVVALAYGGGAGTLTGGPQIGGPGNISIGGRRGMSDVAWHPDNATRLVTASEDDTSPIIMVWDLRNARAPEKILTGHEKGVLSLSWCKQDADLLLSCGKDNRALCWNPQTSEIIGELPSADNWAFQVQWCPRNPDLLATAFFDGTIGIHSLQSTNEVSTSDAVLPTPKPDGADVFDVPGFSRTTQGSLTLKQPPKWLRRPTSCSFGYGGKLVSVSNLPSAQGKNQSSIVHIRSISTEPSIINRANNLKAAIDGQALDLFAEEKSQNAGTQAADVPSWKALVSLFKADSRDELVTLLGFSKSEIAARVAEAIENLKSGKSALKSTSDVDVLQSKPHEPIVSFVEPEREAQYDAEQDMDGDALDEQSGALETTPSEVSASAASDTTNVTKLADGESTTTAPSLFGDDLLGTPQTDAAADFFSSMGTIGATPAEQVRVPHYNYAVDSSVAATMGSRPSSVASDALKNNTFRIYPTDESDTDRLVTKALVLGDFESAVSLCLSSDRFADAILLAVKGGPDLLQRTQKSYFERRTTSLPYLRLFQSIVTNDLADIVQNADLQEWQEIFVVLCTFAKADEFSGLAEQLGQRLEFQGTLIARSQSEGAEATHREFRKYATLTYLAAGRLEKVVNIWIQEMAEEEALLTSSEDNSGDSRYSAHAHALQTLIEKVTVFRSATNYVDTDLDQTTPVDAVRSYKLTALYDRYFEYADLLAAQGLVKEAVTFVNLAPNDFTGSPGSEADFQSARDRLLHAAGATRSANVAPSAPVQQQISSAPSIPASSNFSHPYGYPQYTAPPAVAPATTVAPPATTSSAIYDGYSRNGTAAPTHAANPYAPPPAVSVPPLGHQPLPPSQSAYPSNPYNQPSAISQPSFPNQGSGQVPPPLTYGNGSISGRTAPPPAAAPPKPRENGGWNDAPTTIERRTPGPLNLNKPSPITSPFPNAPVASGSVTPGSPFFQHGQPPPALPPPPRPGSVQSRGPPPPQASQRIPPPTQHGPPAPFLQQGHPIGGPPHGSTGPPSRIQSPQGPPRQPPPPSQLGQPGIHPRGPIGPGQGGPPGLLGPYGRGTPPPGQGPPGPYPRATPPPGQPGPYQSAAPVQPPPPGPGPYGPPPGARPMAPGQGPDHGAPPPLLARNPPPAATTASPPQKGPPPPKYPPGDRSHIPESSKPAFNVIVQQLNRLKQTTPPQQKRLVDDTERRLNVLFDALNCETISQPVVEQLLVLTSAIEAHDRERALAIHVDLLTNGSRTDDIGLWMAGVKQLIMRL